MKKCLHISSTMPVNITLNGQKSYTINPDNYIHLLVNNNFYATFMPITQTSFYLPYTTNLPCATNSHITCVPYYNGHVDVLYSPQKITNWNKLTNVFSKKYQNAEIIISTDGNSNYISIFENGIIKYQTITPKLDNISVEVNTHFIMKASYNSKPFIIALDNNYKEVIHGQIDIVEQNDNILKSLQFIHDINNQGVVTQIDTKSGISKQYLIYEKDSQDIIDTKLIPMAFLQCVKYGNYSKANTYLVTPSNKQSFESFFGKINDIYLNVYDQNHINYTIIGESIRSYNFEIEENKISDIEEVSFQTD